MFFPSFSYCNSFKNTQLLLIFILYLATPYIQRGKIMKDFYLCFPDENLRHGAAEWHVPRLSCHTREIKSTMPPANPLAESWVVAASLPPSIMVGFAISTMVSMPFAKARGLQQRLACVVQFLRHVLFSACRAQQSRKLSAVS